MIDFQLNNRGDMILERRNPLPCYRIDWNVSSYPVFILSFLQGGSNKGERSGFEIQFQTMTNRNEEPSASVNVKDDDEIRQRMIILLRTELGGFSYDKTFGTNLERCRHKQILDESNLQNIGEIVQEVIQTVDPDNVDDYYIRVAPKHNMYTDFYTNHIRIEISKKSEPFFDFDL